MRFELKKGKRGADPKKDSIFVITLSEAITLKDLFSIVKALYENEDRIYPPPKFKGSKMLLEALDYLRTHTVSETLLKFQLRKPEKLHDFLVD